MSICSMTRMTSFPHRNSEREVREGNVAMSETRSLSLKKVKTIKKSMAKRRREERKLKLQILMRESIKAADHDDSS
jgi:hypothetical protein